MRAATNAAASPSAASVGTAMPYCVPWPPGAVTAAPAVHRSASSVASIAVRSARSAALRVTSPIMSSSVVTPKRSASRRASPQLCTCASIRPGSRVLPLPSMACTPAGMATSAPTAAMRPWRTTTVARGSTWSPSNTRTSRIAKLLPSVSGAVAVAVAAGACP